MKLPTNAEKESVWKAYHERRPGRVPVMLGGNPRILLLDPKLNPDGITFEQAAHDPRAHVEAALRFQLHLRTTLHRYADSPTGLPEVWDIQLHVYNVFEAAFFGAEVRYPAGQVPCTEPFLNDSNKRSVLDVDVEHPLENPFIKRQLAFWQEMEAICKDLRFEGRPVRLNPWAPCSSDGPLTAGCNMRGSEFLMDLMEDPEFADALMDRVTRAAIRRRESMWAFWGNRPAQGQSAPTRGCYPPWENGMADDSCAMISEDMYVQRIMPLHRRFYEAAGRDSRRSMHLCGNASHLFPAIHRELGVMNFDTGFPIDHGALRRQLGPDVEISGGPEVALLLGGTPRQVFERTRDILQSGVMEGGRFILREGNNLPPCCPEANLEAMYQAALEFGHPAK